MPRRTTDSDELPGIHLDRQSSAQALWYLAGLAILAWLLWCVFQVKELIHDWNE